MALNPEQIQLIVNFSAFDFYSEPQKNQLKETLSNPEFSLSMAQMELLFGDSASGGLVPNLIVDAGVEESRQIGKMIVNMREERSGMGSYPPTPILQNILDGLGPYNDDIANDAKNLILDYFTIYGIKRAYEAAQGMFSPSLNKSAPSKEYLTHCPKNIQRNPTPTLWSRNVYTDDGMFSIIYSASECYNLMRLVIHIQVPRADIDIRPFNENGRKNIIAALEKAQIGYECLDNDPDNSLCVKIDHNLDSIVKVIESLEGNSGFARGMRLKEDIELLNSKLQPADNNEGRPSL